MAETNSKAPARSTKKGKRVVAFDGDKLGHVAALVVAVGIMGFCFFYRKMDLAPTLVRVGWVFVATYGLTFFFVRTILRTTLFELVVQQQEQGQDRSKRISIGSGGEQAEEEQAEEEQPEGEQPESGDSDQV